MGMVLKSTESQIHVDCRVYYPFSQLIQMALALTLSELIPPCQLDHGTARSLGTLLIDQHLCYAIARDATRRSTFELGIQFLVGKTV